MVPYFPVFCVFWESSWMTWSSLCDMSRLANHSTAVTDFALEFCSTESIVQMKKGSPQVYAEQRGSMILRPMIVAYMYSTTERLTSLC